jgi:hypothetical protein
MLVHDWSAIESYLLDISDEKRAIAWRTAWYIWNVHKQGILCVVSKDGLVMVPFSNENFNNRFAWPVNSSALTFLLDGQSHHRHDTYYFTKMRRHGIEEGPLGVIKDQSAWWLNGHILCNTAGKWSTRGIESMFKALSASILPWPKEKCVFFLNRRDFPLLMNESKITPHWPAFGRKPEVPMFYGIEKWSTVLSFYGSRENRDILWPVPEHWALHKESFSSWPKIPKAVFRGTLTGRYVDNRNKRVSLVRLGHPDIDAGLTAWTPRCRLHENVVSYDGKPYDITLAQKMSPYDQSKYAVILYFPGHAASMRLGWHYLSGSCVIKIEDDSCSAQEQWFDTLATEEHAFVENKHFLKTSLSDLPNILLRLHTVEGMAQFQSIGTEAQKVAMRVFNPDFMRSFVRAVCMRNVI